MSSVLCGKPASTGPCQRQVSAPGAPCGVDHPAGQSPSGAPPSGTTGAAHGPGLDPFRVEPDGFGWASAEDMWSAATDPATSPEILERLAASGPVETRAAVAKNRAASPEILDRLADDDSSYVRTLTAGHPATPPAALVRLASDDHPDPRNRARQRLN